MSTPYDAALVAFNAAETKYQNLAEEWTTGMFFDDLAELKPEVQVREYRALVKQVHEALEDRNVKLKEVATILRQQVMLNVTQWRGIDGKATVLDAGPFKVMSTTHRGFDPRDLQVALTEKGLWERFLHITYTDKDGKEQRIAEWKLEVEFDPAVAWLKANKLDDVLQRAYNEYEKTPRVSGPKPLAFLGEPKKD